MPYGRTRARQRAVDVGFRSDMSGSADTPQETAELQQQGFQDHTVDGQGVAVTATVNTTALNNIVQKFAATKAEDDALDSVARSQQAKE
jgi:hypothetical protein